MDKDEVTPRNYKVEQMVAAVTKGAARQIERMKFLAAELESQEEQGSTNNENNSQDTTAANSRTTVSTVAEKQQGEK